MKERIIESLIKKAMEMIPPDSNLIKNVPVPGILFLKYISYRFHIQNKEIRDMGGVFSDRFRTPPFELENWKPVFLPLEARFDYLVENADKFTLTALIDDAVEHIDVLNFQFRHFLPGYTSTHIDKQQLSEFIKLLGELSENTKKTVDVLRCTFKYIARELLKPAIINDSLFISPDPVNKLMVHLIAPVNGVIFDPCCCIGDLLIEAARFIQLGNPAFDHTVFYGQSASLPLWQLCCMNMEMNETCSQNISFSNSAAIDGDRWERLKADFIFCAPPFNRNSFDWLNYCLFHLADGGEAALLLSGESLDSKGNNGHLFRKNIIDSKILDCIVLLPDNLIPGKSLCIWIISKNRRTSSESSRRREDEILFINTMAGSKMKKSDAGALSEKEINSISRGYQKWKKSGRHGLSREITRRVSRGDIVDSDYDLLKCLPV